MKPSLFHPEHFGYTTEAVELDNEMTRVIEPFFQRGYNPREVAYLLLGVVSTEASIVAIEMGSTWRQSQTQLRQARQPR
jgi:hypothetical protein